MLRLPLTVSVVSWSLFVRGTTPLFWLISWEGLTFGVASAIKIDGMIISGLVFLSATRIEEMVLGLIRLRVPFQAAFAFSLGIRMVPTIIGTALTVTEAQRSRGLDLESGGLVARIRTLLRRPRTSISDTAGAEPDLRVFGQLAIDVPAREVRDLVVAPGVDRRGGPAAGGPARVLEIGIGEVVVGDVGIARGVENHCTRRWSQHMPKPRTDNPADNEIDKQIPHLLRIFAASFHFPGRQVSTGKRPKHKHNAVQSNT